MKNQCKMFVNIFKYSTSASVLLTLSLVLANIILGLVTTLQTLMIGQIVGNIIPGTVNRGCLPFLLGLLIALFIRNFLMAVIPWLRILLLTRVKSKMTIDFFYAVDRIDAVTQELSEEQFRFGRASDFINRNFEDSLRSFLVLVADFTSMVSILVLLGQYHLMFPVISVVTSLPIVFIRLAQDKAMYAMYKKQYPSNQLGNYYLESLTTKDSLIELQIFGCKSLFLDRYQDIARENTRQRTKYFISHILRGNLWESLLILVGNVGLVGFALYLLLNGSMEYTIGMLSVVITGVMTAQEDVISFAFNGKSISDAAMYGEDFWDLLEKKHANSQVEKVKDPICTIELKDVSFHYPNRQDNQIEGINLTIHTGEIIGIVGENGSGKSTLSKILMGLYVPCKGEIRVNDVAVPRMPLAFDGIGAVFQDYVRYELTIGENIWFSASTEPVDEDEVLLAAREANAEKFIEKMEHGYETPVGTLLRNSVQLSGGEWQKLAVARGFYKSPHMLILDEPNASMDIMSEAELYRQYYRQTRGRNHIGVFISHRLGSTCFCDRIIVLKDGRIVQNGTFEELVNEDGVYKTMYETQSKWYQRN